MNLGGRIVWAGLAVFMALAAGLVMTWRWSERRLAEGVTRGSMLTRGMPTFLNRFPAYEICGSIKQRYEPRDGERSPASSLSYASRLPVAELEERYRAALAGMGCTPPVSATSGELKTSCPAAFVADLTVTIAARSPCATVEVFWWGGEE